MNPDSFPFQNLAWLVLLLPLLSAVTIGLFTRRDARRSAQLSITAVALAFVVSLLLFCLPVTAFTGHASAGDWLNLGNLKVELGLVLGPLSLMMLLVVTGVGGAIHVYSYGYMREDPDMGRYFGSLSLFMFSMLGIVLANNFVMMFIFWELVG